jgi:hypothetical protein
MRHLRKLIKKQAWGGEHKFEIPGTTSCIAGATNAPALPLGDTALLLSEAPPPPPPPRPTLWW